MIGLVSSAPDPNAAGKTAEHKVSLETRIALIGVVGALVGALTGGLVTWVVTQDQIASQRVDSHRAERLDAYSKYFGDAAYFANVVFTLYDKTPTPKSLPGPEVATLRTLGATLERDYALVDLLAPEGVRRVALDLLNSDIDLGNALESSPILVHLFNEATRDNESSLQKFVDAARHDLGSAAQ
jgi:hypothetical protein